ncbi:MAG: hypothetical protein M3460_30390 [Actinomycetota bacterium]|nr:hypothetical protein [Actinomycetota bacterium]
MSIGPTVVTVVATGIVPLFVAALSYRQATRANRQTAALETRKVDAEAFGHAQAIYKDAINTLKAELAEARARIAELEHRLNHSSGAVRRQ